MSGHTRAHYERNTGNDNVDRTPVEEQHEAVNSNVSRSGEEQHDAVNDNVSRSGEGRIDAVNYNVPGPRGRDRQRIRGRANVFPRGQGRRGIRTRMNRDKSPESISESQKSEILNDSVQRRTWLLILFVIMNVFLLLENTFQIYYLEKSDTKWWKLSPISAAVLFVILLTIYICLCRNRSISPSAPLGGRQKTALIGIFTTGLGVYVAIELYLYLQAAVEYHETIWQSIPKNSDSLVAPSFAIMRGEGDAAYANFEENWPKKCNFPAWGKTDCSDSFVDQGDFTSAVYGKLHYKLFDAAKKQPPITMSNLSEKVLLQTFVTYDSSAIESDKGGYGTRAPQNPYLLFAVYDPSLPSFTQALECGIIHLSEIPALGANVLTITPYVMSDDVGAVEPSDKQQCGALTHYTYYMTEVSSTGTTNSTPCDTSSPDYQKSYACISQVTLRYSTFLDTEFKSMRKLDKKQIYIDEGAIAGGVVFLTWFFSIFVFW